jgi:predicted TIM-barrel fold metal-dependent hydrolase
MEKGLMAKQGFKVLDSDMHLMEPLDLWERYIDPKYKSRAPKGGVLGVGGWLYSVDGKYMPWPLGIGKRQFRTPEQKKYTQKYKSFAQRKWSPETQIEAMDAEGIDVTVSYPTLGLYSMAVDDMELEFALAVSQAYNNWLYDYCAVNRNRMLAAAMVPPHDVELAVGEARRAVKEMGFRAVFLRPNPVHGRNWYEPYYEPLWSALEEMDVALGFHEGIGSILPQVGDRFGDNAFLRHVACHSMEMMLAVMSMCGGGVLERHPKLRVAFLEANCGWAPWIMERMDDHYEIQFGVTPEELPEEPSEYFKRQCVVSAESDERFVKQVIDYMGDDNIVYSTDWPHPDSKYPHAVESFLENEISDASKRKILWDNCARLYGVKG